MALFNHNSQTLRAHDPSDAYANGKQLFLSFYHLPSQLEVNFKAFITSYAENLASEWHPEKVFGRADAIMTFKSTARTFSVSWSIPAYTPQEAKANLAKCNRLIKFMYPAYEKGNRANTLSKPPLMRIRFANLIRNSAAGPDPSARGSGLLGTMGSLTVTPSFDESGGFFDPGSSTLYPKLITVTCNFTVLHEHDVGWGPEIGFNDPELADYPFGGTEGIFPPPASAPADQVVETINAASTDGDRANAAAEALDLDTATQAMVDAERTSGDQPAELYPGFAEPPESMDTAPDVDAGIYL